MTNVNGVKPAVGMRTEPVPNFDLFGDPVACDVQPVEIQTVDKAGDTPALEPVDNPAIAPCRVDQQAEGQMMATAKFIPAPIQLASIPPELQAVANWVVWKLVPNRDKPEDKDSKVLYNARTGAGASSTNPATWSEYAQAVATYNKGGFAGIGFVLNGTARIVGVDIDKCVVDGVPNAEAMELLASLDARYIEFSPSGTGLRAFGYADPLTAGANGQIGDLHTEFYSTGRYLTVTGHSIKTGPLGELTGFAEAAQKAKDGKKEATKAIKAAKAPIPAPSPPLASNTPSSPVNDRVQRYIESALHHAANAVQYAPDGQQNDTLNSEALGLFRIPELDHGKVWDTLKNAALAGNHPESRTLGTLQSARNAAANMPPRDIVGDMAKTNKNPERPTAGFEPLDPNPFNNAPPPAGDSAPPPPAGDSDTLGWSDPSPLPNALPPVTPFDAELLPEALRGWVMDIAERMQCPPDFTAVGAVSALSSLIGARAVVRPKQYDDWRVVPNLWGMIVGRPGVMKSPALNEVLVLLKQFERTERDQWQSMHNEWELDNKVNELANKANEKQAASIAAKDPIKARALLSVSPAADAEPLMRRYLVNNSTQEALADLLVTNEWGLMVFADELHGLLCSMDKQGQEGSRGFYLTGYDGNQGYAIDRIIRGNSFIPRVCFAMLGGIQPSKVQNYVREAVNGGTGDDGLLQRFSLTVWPDIEKEFKLVDRRPDSTAQQAAWAVFERLSQLQPGSENEPKEWQFSSEAQTIYNQWVVPFQTSLRGDDLHPALVSHLAKWAKLVPALALIFALIDTPEANGVIHEQELLRALSWTTYLRTHADRLYAAAVIPETAGAHALLTKIKSGKLCNADGELYTTFTPRMVAVKHWAGLNTPETVRKAADLLADYGWLARECVATGGRPSDRYLVNPATLAGG